MAICLDYETIDYFKKVATKTGVAYQTLINMYLRECAASKRRFRLEWISA